MAASGTLPESCQHCGQCEMDLHSAKAELQIHHECGIPLTLRSPYTGRTNPDHQEQM